MTDSTDNSRRTFMHLAVGTLACAPWTARAAAQSAEGVGQKSSQPLGTYLIVYRPGPKWLAGKPLAEQPLKEHGRYMLELYRRGTLRMAGGFGDDSGGAALIESASIDEARGIAEGDPAVAAGTFIYELRQWRLVPWEQLLK